MKKNMKGVLETQLVQREFDGRWEKLIKILDHENSYTYGNEAGVKVTYTPEKWVVTDVYDFIMQEVR